MKILRKLDGCPLCYAKKENIIKETELYRVVLVDDIPGYVRIILTEHFEDITDLLFNDYQKLTAEVYKVEKAIRKVFKPDKVNVVSLGNYEPHIHIHIIPRYKDDAWFPDTIWNEKHREYEYQTTEKQIDLLIKEIQKKGKKKK